jgi:hypothetical protein
MESFRDPDTQLIKDTCKSLIGIEIRFAHSTTFPDGTVVTNPITDCNITGYSMESILLPHLISKIPTIERGPKQASPDFWNRNRQYEYELKVFTNAMNFDIGNFVAYIKSLANCGLMRKLYKTKYLIFKYSIDEPNGCIIIDDFKMCEVFELVGLDSQTYPITIQRKSGTWYNIRPCSFNMIYNNRSAAKFLDQLYKAITSCPNHIENREQIIEKIKQQFAKIQFDICLETLITRIDQL